MRSVTVDTYHKDPPYPIIARAVDAILAHGEVVAPVDVFLRMELLEPVRLPGG